jgi:hypothetical protein
MIMFVCVVFVLVCGVCVCVCGVYVCMYVKLRYDSDQGSDVSG